MAVYADILVLVNFLVDYFLLRLTALMLHKKPRLWRMLLGAFTGGLFSLYIFLPQSAAVLEIFVHILMCGITAFITFGFGGVRDYLRCVAVLFGVNFAYSGGMIAVWYIFKPYGMVVNNSVVYFNISPIFLIVFSVAGYFIVALLRSWLKKSFPQNCECSVKLFVGSDTVSLCGIVDTGNSLRDPFGMSQIIIIGKDTADILLGESRETDDVKRRYRAIPCATATGTEILDGYRLDRAEITHNNLRSVFKNPIAAISKAPLCDCQAIVNSDDLTI